MWTALFLAWRNLLRNRRRSGMTLAAMVLGFVTVMLFGGYIRNLDYGLQTDFVQLTGHLQIQHKDYFHYGGGNPAAYGVEPYDRIVQTLRQDPEMKPLLAVASPILQVGGIAGNFAAGVSTAVYVTGTVVEEQNLMREWNEYAFPELSRRLSLSGTPVDSVVIGTGVARMLQLCERLKVPDCKAPEPSAPPEAGATALAADIADLSLAEGGAAAVKSPAAAAAAGKPRIEILSASARGAPNVASVTVLSAEFQGIKEIDDAHVGMHLAQAQRLVFGSAPPRVTAIAVQLRESGQIEVARQRIEALLRTRFPQEPLAIVDFETLNPYYGQARSMFFAIFGFISVLIGAIVLFAVTNTMAMAIIERTTEIGTLRAIGLRRRDVRRIFVLEGLLLGVAGALIGILLALLLATIINQVGLTWLPPGRTEPIPLAVRVAGEYPMLLAGAVVVVVVSALSAIIPSARATRMNIVEALRHV